MRFLTQEWNSNESSVLEHVDPNLKKFKSIHSFPHVEEYTKTLGMEWNSHMDHFCLTVSPPPQPANLTKHTLILMWPRLMMC